MTRTHPRVVGLVHGVLGARLATWKAGYWGLAAYRIDNERLRDSGTSAPRKTSAHATIRTDLLVSTVQTVTHGRPSRSQQPGP